MKTLLNLSIFCIVSFLFTFSSSAETVYYDATGKQITAEEYQTIIHKWRAKINEMEKAVETDTAEALSMAENPEEIGVNVEDQAALRKKRIEQWKKYRSK